MFISASSQCLCTVRVIPIDAERDQRETERERKRVTSVNERVSKAQPDKITN